MTHFLVKHSDGKIRFHAEDGTEPLSETWMGRPDKHDIATAIAEEAPGGSLWGQADYRNAMVDTLSGEFVWRDLTNDAETVPWQ